MLTGHSNVLVVGRSGILSSLGILGGCRVLQCRRKLGRGWVLGCWGMSRWWRILGCWRISKSWSRRILFDLQWAKFQT